MTQRIDHPPRPPASHLLADVRIKFDASLLLQVTPFMASCDIRYYLNGLRVEAAKDRGQGVYLVATDGHHMGVVYDPNGSIENDRGAGVIMRVPPGLVSACRKRPARGLPNMVLAEGLRVSVAPDFGFAHSPHESYIMPGDPWVEGRYPDWVNVLPVFADLKVGTTSTVNAKFIADFDKIVPREVRKYGTHITFWQVKPNSTIIVQIHNLPNFVGIVMPVRDDGEDALRSILKPMFSAKPIVPPAKPQASSIQSETAEA